ncbi:DUF2304 domain-containing protein [Paenibacillus sp.]|uniref:DUF2304 domain-containing protein n=1 Tax=Paenibacillus sp. TaxID=58172 RepID=UPI002D2687D5|nr:DUF2304 domain-containing protein [Paenibacillus sp.]HZG86186.1 DUF2304 domain-containing protein [Paenibacillus sp.]
MSSVQVISLVVSFGFTLIVIYFTGKHKLKDKYAFFWLVLSFISLLLVPLIPLLNRFAETVGIQYMPSLFFLLAFILMFSISIYIMTVLSNHQESIRRLIQDNAFLLREVEELRKQLERTRGKNDVDP